MKITVITTFLSIFILFTLGTFITVNAQPQGSASNAGSLAKEVIIDRNNPHPISDLVKYRFAIKNLQLNEDVLIAQLEELKEKKAKIKLKDLILAHLVIQKDPVETVKTIDEFINQYQNNKDFYKSLYQFLSLDKITASIRKSTADQTLKKAQKVK